MTAPLISITPDLDGGYVLMATVRGQLDVAGPRLLRGGPWPEVAWQHATQEAAAADARKLQAYLDEAYGKRGPSKKKLRGAGG